MLLSGKRALGETPAPETQPVPPVPSSLLSPARRRSSSGRWSCHSACQSCQKMRQKSQSRHFSICSSREQREVSATFVSVLAHYAEPDRFCLPDSYPERVNIYRAIKRIFYSMSLQ